VGWLNRNVQILHMQILHMQNLHPRMCKIFQLKVQILHIPLMKIRH